MNRKDPNNAHYFILYSLLIFTINFYSSLRCTLAEMRLLNLATSSTVTICFVEASPLCATIYLRRSCVKAKI